MPRVIEETWTHVQWGVVPGEMPLAGDDGHPLHDALGNVRTATVTFLILAPEPGRVIRVPLSDDVRRQIAAQLAGGIVVPSLNGAG